MIDTSILANLMPLLSIIAVVFIVLLGIAGLFKAFYHKVAQGTALIVNDMTSSPKVYFTGALVYPIIHKMELMNISLITLEIDRRGRDGLICKDNLRADINVAFYLRVNETQEDVLRVAKAIGAERASDKQAIELLFAAKFSEALKTVGKQIEFISLFENRLQFREKIIEVIGNDLSGYVLEDVAIDYIEQTPKSSLDPSNILDAEGIKKITELTAAQNVRTNILERDQELAIKKKNVETTEAMLELERQQADAEARQKREIASIRAREEAETKKVQEEERKKYEQTAIAVAQDLAVQTQNQQREIEVAEQNRKRAVAIEEERVLRARELEIVARKREVELQTIEAEKAVELQRKEIANVIRDRVVVDKSVAIEEERIKEVREVSLADRQKQIQVLHAEASAEEEKVKQVKSAEAQELSSKHKAQEIMTLAQANLDASAKEAEAKKKMAEGTLAERAAPGLAEAKILEARADALEKQGMAEANIIRAKGNAEADAGKAQADVITARGTAEADIIAAKGSSEATAQTEIGLAHAKVTREQFKAEADGLIDKFGAMNSMSQSAREHEEYRMSLETALKETLASIEAGKEIAKENAEILAIALQKAHIDIVGGEAQFFDNFAKSLSIGKAIDGLASKSGIIGSVLDRLIKGKPVVDTSPARAEVIED